jgi:hypothetical protein
MAENIPHNQSDLDPINNVVDITKLCMMSAASRCTLVGSDSISGKKIIVKNAGYN